MTDGGVLWGLVVFLVGGAIMMLCAASFATLSAEGGDEGGLVGYAEKMCGAGFARFAALFSADFYLPSMTATLAYVSGDYFCRSVGAENSGVLHATVSGAFLVLFFAANTLTPRAAGKFQIVSTALKLLPLLAVGAVGCVSMIKGGVALLAPTPIGGGFVSALLSSAFAYEGWIAVTALGGEVKNAKRNMPLALTVGSAVVLSVYVFYYFGVVGASGSGSSVSAFTNVFGERGGRAMLFFVTLSCLGALNGLTMSVVRGHYILSGRLLIGDRRDRLFGEISAVTGIPVSSGIMGLLVSEAWLIVRFFSPSIGAEGLYFDPAEASISVMYAIYVPILLMMTVRLKIKSRVKRYILPVSAAIAASFVALAAPIAFGWAMALFVLAVAAVTLIVLSIYRR